MINPATISHARNLISQAIERERLEGNSIIPVDYSIHLPEPVERKFLVLRGAAMTLWIVAEKENDPDRKVIVFHEATQRFGVAAKSIGTIPDKGFFLSFCTSFEDALNKSGITLW